MAIHKNIFTKELNFSSLVSLIFFNKKITLKFFITYGTFLISYRQNHLIVSINSKISLIHFGICNYMNISVENLTKQYGPQKAVDTISFKVKTGEILGFLGPNGAGKTTTMKILTCFMAPTEGDVKVGEYSIHDHQDKIKSMIGYLPENNPLVS